MNPSGPESSARLGEALLESDRRYFELGANLLDIPGGVLAWMPGMEEIPGGAVVQRVSVDDIGPDPAAWTVLVTDAFASLGCGTARVYLDEPVPALEEALRAAGYRRRVEIGYVANGAMAGSGPAVTLRAIRDEVDWEVKAKLHAGSIVASDGHSVAPEQWVELERRKCEAGEMEALLVAVDGMDCGSVATIRSGPLLRVKNLFVHPDRRREGIAAHVVRRLALQARAVGAEAGLYGVEGKPGNAVYRHLSMTPVTSQIEWARSVRGLAP